MKFLATRLKKSIFPYVSFLAQIKMQDLCIREKLQYVTLLEDAIKKNAVPKVMEIPAPSSFVEARDMFSKMISEAANANIMDEEVRELKKVCLKQSVRMNTLSTKIEELQDQFLKKFKRTAPPQLWAPSHMDAYLAYKETIEREMDYYREIYESLIKEMHSLNIDNASDASVDFVIKRSCYKLDEAIIRRVLDEWIAFKRDLNISMEKFDFTLYLLDDRLDLVLQGDYEGLANVVRPGEGTLSKNDREEAVSELLKNWKYYKRKGTLKKKVKSFKEEIQQKKESQYEVRMKIWKLEAVRKKFLSSKSTEVDTREVLNEVKNEDASSSTPPEGLQMVDDNTSRSATPQGLHVILEP